MEDDDLSNPKDATATATATVTVATAKTLDPSTERKHAAMLERLSNLHQSRLQQQSLSRQSNPDSSSFESTQSFLSCFSHSKLSIESHLSRIHQSPDPHSNPPLKSDLDSVSVSISNLEKLVAQNSYFLPPFEVRTCLKTISDLKQTLENVTSDVIPKKKFTFKSKPTKKGPITVVNETQVEDRSSESQKEMGFKVRDSPGFRSRENEVLVKEFKGGPEEIGEFTISDLSNCEVRLMGCLRALFIHRLRNCRVYAGPVFGSILMEEVEGCVFVLASHQIRIHRASVTDFYLRVRSRPIIEDSNGLRFAPYCLCYDGIESDLKQSNLDEEIGNWANVDDFRWLRAVQSPNWSILPESDRIGTLNILKSET